MPYNGVPANKTADMDKCVQALVAKGEGKPSAVAICHAQVMGTKNAKSEEIEKLKSALLNNEAIKLNEQVSLAEAEVNSDLREVKAVLIQSGVSLNKRLYPATVLESAAPMYEGRKAYIDHEGFMSGHGVRDIAGYWHDTRFMPEKDGQPAKMIGTFKAVGLPDNEWEKVKESVNLVKQGKEPLIGLSHDAQGKVKIDRENKYMTVEAIEKVNSVDWVTEPAAGGLPFDVIENIQEEIEIMKNKNDEAVAGSATGPSSAASTSSASAKKASAKENILKEEVQNMKDEKLSEMEKRLAKLESEKMVKAVLSEAKLPEVIARKLTAHFDGSVVSKEEVEKAIDLEKDVISELSKVSKNIEGTKDELGSGLSERDKVQLALDGFFGLDNDKGVKPYMSIRKAYSDITGDETVSGEPTTFRSKECKERRIYETIETGDFSILFGTSMHRKLVKDYTDQPFDYRQLVSVTPIQNFKRQDLVRYGAFGGLYTISEGGSYPALTEPTEENPNYAAAKHGGKVEITRESIINDDLGALRRVPGKMAYAARITLAKFVYGFYTQTHLGSGDIYDSRSLYASAVGGNHANTLAASTALSATALNDAIMLMKKQTDQRGDRIGVTPKALLIPSDLLWNARIILQSTANVDQANPAVVNPNAGSLTIIEVPQFTGAKNWYVVAEPMSVESVELGFVGGREEPELILQDGETVGKVFTNDTITYKVRHEYGGTVVDYRACVRGGNFGDAM